MRHLWKQFQPSPTPLQNCRKRCVAFALAPVLALSTGTSSLFIDIVSQSGKREVDQPAAVEGKGKRSLIHHRLK